MDTKTNDSPTIKTSNINAIAAVMALLVVMMTNLMNIICIYLHNISMNTIPAVLFPRIGYETGRAMLQNDRERRTIIAVAQ